MNRAQRRQCKKRREVRADDEGLQHSYVGLSIAMLEKRVLTPADAERLQVSYLDFARHFLMRTDKAPRDVLSDFSDEEDVVMISGIVSDVKYGGYVDRKSGKVFENVISRVCLSDPLVFDRSIGLWKSVDSHVWVFTDRLYILPESSAVDVRVKLGEILDIACLIKPYRHKGVLRYGPSEWAPVRSQLQYQCNGKTYTVPKKLIKSPDVLSLEYDAETGSCSKHIALKKDVIPELLRLKSLAFDVRQNTYVVGAGENRLSQCGR